ncbi:MAG: hypothetical protein ACREN6_14685 [Gemmatimonadaceae bacterium]
MTNPVVFWPGTLGILFLIAGIVSYWHDFRSRSGDGAFGLTAFGPVFVASALAAFAGEHFTIAPTLARMVPKFLPGRLFIAYFVGVALLAAALSFVARRCVRWATLGVALNFALFVLLMDLPSAIAHPTVRMAWSLAAREGTFAIGGLALFAATTTDGHAGRTAILATIIRIWTAAVLVFYGIENVVFPKFSPGVPSQVPTPAWVPLATAITYATGILVIIFGLLMFAKKYAGAAAARCGLLMAVLTAAIYAPQWAMARGTSEQVLAINFVFDTLLFAGTMLVIARAISVNKET